MTVTLVHDGADIACAATTLLARDGADDGGALQLHRLPGGRNNRVYRAEVGDRRFFIKQYHRDAADPRDRLGAEYGFLQFARSAGVRCVPMPIASDAQRGLAAYEYVDGEVLRRGMVTHAHVNQAAAFVAAINAHRDADGAASLPAASEACFSLTEHIVLVRRRLQRLTQMKPATRADSAAMTFVTDRLAPRLDGTCNRLLAGAGRAGIDPAAPLGRADRCISPSDFGFHNALRRKSGELCFIDFEYAGWDDPAKLVCDFFCQPAVPPPAECFNSFAGAAASLFDAPAWHIERINLLRPLYRLKWCCIVLNEFLPQPARRRAFAQHEPDEQRKAAQLDLAIQMFDAEWV